MWLFNRIIILLFSLTLIRGTSIFDSIYSNIEVILRLDVGVENAPKFLLIILYALAFVVLGLFTKKLGKASNYIKNSFFTYFFTIYIITSLFNRSVFKNYSYLFLGASGKLPLEDFGALLTLDLFFEEPYIFWFAILMLGGFVFLKSKGRQEYTIPLFILPFYFLEYQFHYAYVILVITCLTISLIGFFFSKKESASFYTIIQGILHFIVALQVAKVHGSEFEIPKVAAITLVLYYLPSFLLLYICNKRDSLEAKNLSWLIPTVIFVFSGMPLSKTSLVQGMVASSFYVNAFVFAGNLGIIVSLIALVAYIASRIRNSLGKATFNILSAVAVLYYLLDALLYHYSHFHLNMQTLAWTMNMNDIVATTVKTCINYIDAKSLMVFVALIAIIILSFKKANKILSDANSAKWVIMPILISAQLSSTLLLSMSKFYPVSIQDPFYLVIKDVKLLNETRKLSNKELEEAFLSCKIPIKKYENKESLKGNGYNLIFVTLESVQWRYLNMFGKEDITWPEMSKYANRMEVFPFFFSNFPESTAGDIAMLTGLQPYSHEYAMKRESINMPNIATELIKAGYRTYLFASGSIIDGNLIGILKTINFDYESTFKLSSNSSSKDYWYWGMKEEKTVDNILAKLKEEKSDKPYFVFYRTVYPHAPFPTMDSTEIQPFKQPHELGRNLVENYKNALFYLDKQLAKLVEGVTKLDKERGTKTIIALGSDHGEMLEEPDNHGLKGHGPYADAKLTNVPFIIIRPEEKGLIINQEVSSQIDIFPTLMESLNLKPSVERYEIGRSLLSQNKDSRPLYIRSMNSCAIIENGYYFYFPNKNQPNCTISKLELNQSLRATFKPILSWSEADIIEKFERTHKYYKLLENFLSRY